MNSEVLSEDKYQTTVDSTRTGYHTIAKEVLLLHAEVMATMFLEHIILFEGTFVEQHFNTLAGCVLSALVLFLNCFFATTETGLFALLDELLNLV